MEALNDRATTLVFKAPPLVLSPHLDDAVWSVGALLARLADEGLGATVVTAFTEMPGSLSPIGQHLAAKWGLDTSAIAERRKREDRAALSYLRVRGLHLGLADAVCRMPGLYSSKNALAGAQARVDSTDPAPAVLTTAFADILGDSVGTVILAPLGIGGHVDHQIVAQAASAIQSAEVSVWFYEEFPYCILSPLVKPGFLTTADSSIVTRPITIRMDGYVDRHAEAACLYASQVAGFFDSEQEFKERLRSYLRSVGEGEPAIRLWSVLPRN